MLRLRALALPVIVAALTLTLLAGCGGGGGGGGGFKKTLDEIDAQIKAFEAKGVPPSEMSMAKVHLSTARDELERRNKAKAKKAVADSKEELVKAQKFYDEQVATLGPKIDAQRSAAIKAKEELTGYQARKIDSTVAAIDSLKRVERALQANAVAQALVASLPSLKEDEQKAARLKKLVPGEWVFEERAKSEEHKEVNALTRKVFKFGADGKIYLTESKKGQSGPYLKEDWLFESWGTYGYKGDTIMLSVSRFKATRQMFERIHKINEKLVWKPEPGPTYDSAITDGSQDRYVTYDDLKLDFKKVR